MSTARFNANILVAARRMGDKRATPDSSDDANKRYSSAVLSDYQNRAIKDLVKDLAAIYKGNIADVVPEIVKTSPALVITAGEVIKTDDMWTILSIATAGGIPIKKLAPEDVDLVRNGKSPLVTPSVTRPYYYEEEDVIKILPASLATSVYVRYVEVQADLTVDLGTDGDGKYDDGAAGGTYDLSTKLLAIGMTTNFDSTDINRFLTFQALLSDEVTTQIFFGKISSIKPAYSEGGTDFPPSVYLYGDTLPTETIHEVQKVMVAGIRNFQSDVKLAPYWDGDIIQRMINMAISDIPKQ